MPDLGVGGGLPAEVVFDNDALLMPGNRHAGVGMMVCFLKSLLIQGALGEGG